MTLLGHLALTDRINCLTETARAQGVPVAWIKPTPPSAWHNAATARALLGSEQVDRHEREMAAGNTTIGPDLVVADRDRVLCKHGNSAFFPGNCVLPDRPRADGIDTALLAGVLTDICVRHRPGMPMNRGFAS